MITVLGMWEAVWLGSDRAERRLWKQTVEAFGVDAWAMCGIQGGPFSSPTQCADLATMLAAHPGPKTFLIPPASAEANGLGERLVDLCEYGHPSDAIYVFGKGGENLVGSVTPSDDIVSICTPQPAELFGAVALAAVLFDRLASR